MPRNTVAPSESEGRRILRMIDQLEDDDDDVQDVYADSDISEAFLVAVAG